MCAHEILQLLVLLMTAAVLHNNAFVERVRSSRQNVSSKVSRLNLLRRSTGFLAYSIMTIMKEYKGVDRLATGDLI